MNSLSFITTVHNGIIKLPISAWQLNDAEVKVVVMQNEVEQNMQQKDKTNLLNIVNSFKNKNLFALIENPTQWQKQQRSEWE